MHKLDTYCLPATVKEAVAELNAPGRKPVVLGGGTHVAKMLPPSADAVVDARLLKLNYVKADSKWLSIGAMTTFTELLAKPVIAAWAGGILHKAAHTISSRMIRDMGTLGGNLVHPYPYNHFPIVLLALDAQAVIAVKGKTLTVPVSELSSGKWVGLLGTKALLVEIKIPAASKNLCGVFEKFAKTESMWKSYAIVCVTLDQKDGVCRKAAIAVSSAIPKAERFPKAEALLAGQKLDVKLADKAGTEAAAGLTRFVQTDKADYIRELVHVLVRRAVLQACA
ncbi:MAG TPA: FAD binding domain-containing protein [Elusimicrobiales bacterium]|nr:FAD binding domain-containing protein [Elusimicrobiales bacterium]